MGCSTIKGRRVYGRFYAFGSFGPANISRKTFLEYKSVLEEIEISQKWLLKKTGEKFPVAFKTSELHLIDFDVVIDIAKLLGIEYIKSRRPSSTEQAALRRAIIGKVDAL